jgi:hypothetical protein
MLHNLKKLEGLALAATDGSIGKVKDFYFDDEAWVIRYVVAATTKWLGGREVLISPYSIGRIDWASDKLPVAVNKEQVKNSPGIDSHKPISRQFERSYLGYYGYPYYWGGAGLWGEQSYPGPLLNGIGAGPYGAYEGYLRPPSNRDTNADPHLRSCQVVRGYYIHAKDGELGHVQGFLIDDSTWSIRFLIVNTSNWWVGHHVLLSPEWIQQINWADSIVTVDLARQAIKDAPAYDGAADLERNAEASIYTHYGRRGYWHEPATRAA